MGNCLDYCSSHQPTDEPKPRKKEESVEIPETSALVPEGKPDIININTAKVLESSDSDRSSKNIAPQKITDSKCPAIIDSEAFDAIFGYYGREKSIDPEQEYSRLVNDVWPNQIKGTLPKSFSQDKRNKLLFGFLWNTYQIAQGKFAETLGTVAKVITEPFHQHSKGIPDLQRTIAVGGLKKSPEEFSKLPPDMQKVVMSHFKKEAEKVDLGEMADIQAVLQILLEQMFINQKDKMFLDQSNVLGPLFQQPLARVMWMMTNQSPQYRLEKPYHMKPWKTEYSSFLDCTRDSELDEVDAVIKYYSKPVLYLDKEVIDKGLVKVGTW